MLLFTVVTTFTSAVTITVGLRVIIYIVTCAALPVLRRQPGRAPATFVAPAGSALAVASILIAIGLIGSRPWPDVLQLVSVLAVGLLIWAFVARRPWHSTEGEQ
jgi:amino acid transporter